MYLSNEDNSEEESVGVDQALALLPGATAAQEGHQEDHTTDDHQEDWSVHIAVAQEVQVVLNENFQVNSFSLKKITSAPSCIQAPNPMRIHPARMKRMLKKTMKYFTRLSQQFSMVKVLY